MRSVLYILIPLLLLSLPAAQDVSADTSLGINIQVGGVFDNTRLNIYTSGGVKGGLVLDIYFYSRHRLREDSYLIVNIPVLRPFYNAVRYKLFQMDPYVAYKYNFTAGNDTPMFISIGLGLSMYRGPSYLSNQDNRDAAFFSLGPLINSVIGFNFNDASGKHRAVAFSLYYAPLFSRDRGIGTVFGASLERRLTMAEFR